MVAKCLDFSLGQGEIRFENGAYTLVREYFKSNFNAAIDKIQAFWNQFLVYLTAAMEYPRRQIPVPDDVLPEQMPALLLARRAINDPELLS